MKDEKVEELKRNVDLKLEHSIRWITRAKWDFNKTTKPLWAVLMGRLLLKQTYKLAKKT